MVAALALPLLQANAQVAACDTRSDVPIARFCKTSAQTLWRGAKPDVAGAAWLVENGVRTVVNLELLQDDLPTFAQVQLRAATRADVGYFRVRDWEPMVVIAPAVVDERVAHFLAIVRTQPKPVYVHCRSGQNRTGLMVAAFRVLAEGMPTETAVTELARYEGLWFKADAQYIRGLTPARRAKIAQASLVWERKLRPAALLRCSDGACVDPKAKPGRSAVGELGA